MPVPKIYFINDTSITSTNAMKAAPSWKGLILIDLGRSLPTLENAAAICPRECYKKSFTPSVRCTKTCFVVRLSDDGTCFLSPVKWMPKELMNSIFAQTSNSEYGKVEHYGC